MRTKFARPFSFTFHFLRQRYATQMAPLRELYAFNYDGRPSSTSAKATSLVDGGPLKVSKDHILINVFPDVSFSTSGGIYVISLHLLTGPPGGRFRFPLLRPRPEACKSEGNHHMAPIGGRPS